MGDRPSRGKIMLRKGDVYVCENPSQFTRALITVGVHSPVFAVLLWNRLDNGEQTIRIGGERIVVRKAVDTSRAGGGDV